MSLHIGRVLLAFLFGDFFDIFDGDEELKYSVKQIDEKLPPNAVDEHCLILAQQGNQLDVVLHAQLHVLFARKFSYSLKQFGHVVNLLQRHVDVEVRNVRL